jgi:hypothetical protein
MPEPTFAASCSSSTRNSADGTLTLLRTGICIFLVGLLSYALVATVLGGLDRHGPHTNMGWLGLIVALMCMPFGLMLLGLGAAKWARNRRTSLPTG